MKKIIVITDEKMEFELRNSKMVEVPNKELRSELRTLTVFDRRRRIADFNSRRYTVTRAEMERCFRKSIGGFEGFIGGIGALYDFIVRPLNKIHTYYFELGCCWFEKDDTKKIKKWARELPKEKRLR